MVFKIMIAVVLAGLSAMSCRAEFRDPTQPAYPLPPAIGSDGTAVDNDLVLSAIWISAQSRRATINGVSGKQGQTIVVGPVPALNRNTATNNKEGLLNKMMGSALSLSDGDAEMKRPSQDNPMAQLGNRIAPLLSAAVGGSKLLQLQDQRVANKAASHLQPSNNSLRSAPGVKQRPAPLPLSKTNDSPASSSTLKILSVRPNSVTIEQNGELKTLQLVQRPYKTQ